MQLTDQQRTAYENALNVARAEIDDLDRQIEEELAKVKDRLRDLENGKKVSLQMYDAACAKLEIPNDLLSDEDQDGGA